VYQYFFRIDTLELMVDTDAIKRRFESLLPTVDERMRRLIAAAESLAIDYGGISIVSRATGVLSNAKLIVRLAKLRRCSRAQQTKSSPTRSPVLAINPIIVATHSLLESTRVGSTKPTREPRRVWRSTSSGDLS
jgi:hypothetical protein